MKQYNNVARNIIDIIYKDHTPSVFTPVKRLGAHTLSSPVRFTVFPLLGRWISIYFILYFVFYIGVYSVC